MGIFDIFKKKKGQEGKPVKSVVEKKEEFKEKVVKKEQAKEKQVQTQQPKKEDTKDAYKVLVRQIITEKGTAMGEGKFIFEVSTQANKSQVKEAIGRVYGVKPLAVNMIRMEGKKVRFGVRMGKRKEWKKAIVTLRKGATLKEG